MNNLQYPLFTFDVDIGSRFVKNIDGAVKEEGACQCKPLPLSAGKIHTAFLQFGVQAFLRI